MSSSLKTFLGPLFCLLCAGVYAQNYACESLEQYVNQHPDLDCYIYQHPPCSGMECSDYGGSTGSVYADIYVQRCEDPVTVYTYVDIYQNGHYHYYLYEFNQSETVDTYGHYDYHANHNLSSLTAILDRNATHLGFELFIRIEVDEDALWLFDPLYLPLFPRDCMCSSMENVASEIHERTNYKCTVNDDCDEIQCTVRHGTLKSLNLIINSCDRPPSVDVELLLEGDEAPIKIHSDHNTSTELDSLGGKLVIDLWHFDYSMDIEITVVSGIVPTLIVTREKIILDLTECGSHPIDISGDSTMPTEFTEPTAPSTSDTMCDALKAISIEDGSFCVVDKACDALECEIGDHRLEIAVDSCHHPPGIRVEMYNSTNHAVFNQSFYSGSRYIHDTQNHPFNFNVTVQQLHSKTIRIEVIRIPDGLPIVPRTVIPIDKPCKNDSSDSSSSGTGVSTAVIVSAVVAPMVLSLLIAVIIIIIVSVYFKRRRRIREYSFRRMAMSKVDEDEDED